MHKENLGWTTKANYAVGDFGNNIVWNVLGLFIAKFYTDVYGLDPWHMGTMFILVRIFDAITDPIIGSLADKTSSKHGKYRPFILYGAIPLGISLVMLFHTPEFGETGKIIYAYFSYTLLTFAYTVVNVPYSAMVGTLTQDSNEKTSLQSYRFGIGYLASVLVALVMLPSVAFFGGGNDQTGYTLATIVLAVLTVACLFYCFATVKEKYLPDELPESGQKNRSGFDLWDALKNSQLLVILLINSLFVITWVMKASLQIYYIENVMIDGESIKSLFMTAMMAALALGAALSSTMWGRFDKPAIFQTLMLILAFVTVILFWVPPGALYSIVGIWLLASFLMMSTVPVCWSMVSDVVDYQRSLNGKMMSGLIFALFLFTTKLGIGVGGAIIGWVLSAYGYTAGASVQSEETISAINAMATLVPAGLFIICAVVMYGFKLNRKKREEIATQLYGESV